MCKDTVFYKKSTLNIKGKIFDLSNPIVMGILNITPDSFYDGGFYKSESEIIERTQKMLNDGAKIIDVGAVTSKPNSIFVDSNEEIKRINFVGNILLKNFSEVCFSIDTFRANVAKTCVEKFGFSIVNDISAGNIDNDMFKTVAELKVPYIIMHMKGTPDNMQNAPEYENVTNEIINFFSKKISDLKNYGINDIIIDPGFGFGKTINHNYQLIKELKHLCIFNFPIVVGISRKSMIYKLLNCSANEALNGTSVLNTLALLNGADILRVHDVKEAVEAIKILDLYNKS